VIKIVNVLVREIIVKSFVNVPNIVLTGSLDVVVEVNVVLINVHVS
jgi:hypothetical protein